MADDELVKQLVKQITTGKDARGWTTLYIPAMPGGATSIIRVIVDGKELELVTQSESMRVYVNPEKSGFDEWECPIDSGCRLLIGSPVRS